MGTFRNTATGVVVTVDDSKDERYAAGWEPAGRAPAEASAQKRTRGKPAQDKSQE